MLRKILLLLICFVFILSAFSKGKRDETQTQSDQILQMGNTGKVAGFSIENGKLSLEGDPRDIAFSLESNKTMNKLKLAETYTHSHFNRPDGPIDMMELMAGEDLIFWVGDGIRADMGPSGLKVFPDEGVDKIKVETDGKSWDVSLKKETPIVWNDREYIVFVSKIKKGTMQDQPEFSVDLVIMLK